MQAWQQWLAQRSAREQIVIPWAITLLLLWLVWAWAVAPAWQVVSHSPAQRERLAQQLSEMQVLQQRALALRNTPRVSTEQAAQVLQSLAATAGPAVKISRQGQQMQWDFKGLSPQALAELLVQSRLQAHVQVQSAHWQQRDKHWDGQVVFNLSPGL